MVTGQDKAVLVGMLEAHSGKWVSTPPECDVCYCIRNTNATLKGWLNAPSYEATLGHGYPMPLRLCKQHAVDLDLLW